MLLQRFSQNSIKYFHKRLFFRPRTEPGLVRGRLLFAISLFLILITGYSTITTAQESPYADPYGETASPPPDNSGLMLYGPGSKPAQDISGRVQDTAVRLPETSLTQSVRTPGPLPADEVKHDRALILVSCLGLLVFFVLAWLLVGKETGTVPDARSRLKPHSTGSGRFVRKPVPKPAPPVRCIDGIRSSGAPMKQPLEPAEPTVPRAPKPVNPVRFGPPAIYNRQRLIRRLAAAFAPVVVFAVLLGLRHFTGNDPANPPGRVAGISTLAQNPDPDASYTFHENQSDLNPASTAELGLTAEFSEPVSPPAGSKIIKVKSADELDKAVANIQPDQAIDLAPGTYRVNLEITRELVLLGQGENTVLTAADPLKPVISVTAGNTALGNLVIADARIGVSAHTAKLELAMVRLTKLEATAVYAKDSILDIDHGFIYDSGTAIKTVNSKGEIRNSIIKNNTKSGIELRAGRFNIKGNIITGNGSYGVFADGESEVYVNGNHIEENRGYNVRIEGKQEIYK